MSPNRHHTTASIDIGTHSLLMLIARKNGKGEIESLCDKITITRLGEGLHTCGAISPEASMRTIKALKSYLKLCKDFDVEKIKAVGTAALRNAKNSKEFIKRVRQELSLDIEVISGEKEARLTYEASATDFGRPITVLDIGGGSTEFIFGPPPLHLTSIETGCVTLTERFIQSDPPASRSISSLRSHVRSLFEANLQIPDSAMSNEVVATAGTATTLMSMAIELEPYDGKMVHGQRLLADSLDDMVNQIRKKSVGELRRLKGLMPERAHVIVAGAVILQEAMRHLQCEQVTISDRGVRWGVLYEAMQSL